MLLKEEFEIYFSNYYSKSNPYDHQSSFITFHEKSDQFKVEDFQILIPSLPENWNMILKLYIAVSMIEVAKDHNDINNFKKYFYQTMSRVHANFASDVSRTVRSISKVKKETDKNFLKVEIKDNFLLSILSKCKKLNVSNVLDICNLSGFMDIKFLSKYKHINILEMLRLFKFLLQEHLKNYVPKLPDGFYSVPRSLLRDTYNVITNKDKNNKFLQYVPLFLEFIKFYQKNRYDSNRVEEYSQRIKTLDENNKEIEREIKYCQLKFNTITELIDGTTKDKNKLNQYSNLIKSFVLDSRQMHKSNSGTYRIINLIDDFKLSFNENLKEYIIPIRQEFFSVEKDYKVISNVLPLYLLSNDKTKLVTKRIQMALLFLINFKYKEIYVNTLFKAIDYDCSGIRPNRVKRFIKDIFDTAVEVKLISGYTISQEMIFTF